jgi:hypothetical protein
MSFLTPNDRTLLIESLRPPQGYELDIAVGTTFSLDLLAMMVAPVGFTYFNLESGESGGSETTPLELLEAIRRHAGQMVLFCEAGRIAVPPKHRLLFSFLEDRIVEVAMPTGKSFHPKVWVIRFRPTEQNQSVVYRLLCLSRNLTFDQSWDTILVLDGPLREDRTKGFSQNRPLKEFVAALPGLAKLPLGKSLKTQVKTVEDEVGRVEWSLEGTPFSDYQFWPLGLDGKSVWPFKERMERVLVVSPFLTATTLEKLTAKEQPAELISRTECLDAIRESKLDRFDEVYTLSRGDTVGEATDSDGSAPVDADAFARLRGLHAKIYVADDGWNAHVWTGSANATAAAFAGNIEFLVQLTGTKSTVGVAKFLERAKGEASFSSMLSPYERTEDAEVDTELEELRDEIEALRGGIAAADWRLRVGEPGDGGTYVVSLSTEGKLPAWAEHVNVQCRPLSVPEENAVKIESRQRVSAALGAVSLEALTAFVVVSIHAARGGKAADLAFVVVGRLEGAPPNRRDRLLQSMIRDRASLVRFLLLLLADIDGVSLSLDGDGGNRTGQYDAATGGDALLEPLLRALDRRPERLKTIGGLLTELGASEDSKHLIPPGLMALFDAVKGARPGFFK